jgi:23S rRNA (adenine2030-N6)-methyltransferase
MCGEREACVRSSTLAVACPTMNYRHAFHAGNFADVVKHALLARVIVHLRQKEAAFRVIDTHAGAGRTELQGEEAQRGGEWPGGIGRIFDHPFEARVATLLEPYRAAIASCNPNGRLAVYPGSPLLIQQWLRPQDRLIACELESEAARALTRNLRGDKRVKAMVIDGWTALNAFIPPKEKRGLVLIDPPYEREDEFAHAAEALGSAHRKWATGTMLLWYPIKDPRAVSRFIAAIATGRGANSLRIELSRAGQAEEKEKLRGSGLIAINPPWTLAAEAQILLPALARAFWPGERWQMRIAPVSGGV